MAKKRKVKKPASIRKALSTVTKKQIINNLSREDRINIRLSKKDKASLKTTAKMLNMTLTDYILGIHHLIKGKL